MKENKLVSGVIGGIAIVIIAFLTAGIFTMELEYIEETPTTCTFVSLPYPTEERLQCYFVLEDDLGNRYGGNCNLGKFLYGDGAVVISTTYKSITNVIHSTTYETADGITLELIK